MAKKICKTTGCEGSADRADGGKLGLCGKCYMQAYRARETGGEGGTPQGEADGDREVQPDEGNPGTGTGADRDAQPGEGGSGGSGDQPEGLPDSPDGGEGGGEASGEGEGDQPGSGSGDEGGEGGEGGEGEGGEGEEGEGDEGGEGEGGEGEGDEVPEPPVQPPPPGIDDRSKTDMDRAWEEMGRGINRETEQQERAKWVDYGHAVDAHIADLNRRIKDASASGGGGFPDYTPGEFGPGVKVPKDLTAHIAFIDILREFALGENVALVGPAGSGKTSGIVQAAKVLGLEYYSHGAVYSKAETLGYLDAKGDRAITALYRWATNPDGGVLNFDEMDGSLPKALTPLHELLDNRRIEFPGGLVVHLTDKHLCAACMNTYGHGASRQYVARNALDGATLDRFVTIECGYDSAFEKLIFGYNGEDKFADRRREWIDEVQFTRAAVDDLRKQHIVSMRATRRGCAAIEAGQRLTAARKRRYLFSGLDDGQVKAITKRAGELKAAAAAKVEEGK